MKEREHIALDSRILSLETLTALTPTDVHPALWQGHSTEQSQLTSHILKIFHMYTITEAFSIVLF